MKEESDYIISLKNSDKRAFEYLYNKWSGKVYNFAMYISHGNISLSEELLQIVFVKVWEKRETLDPEKSFGAYLCTIAKNILFDIYQKKMREVLLEDISGYDETSENSTEEDVDYHLLDEYVDNLIEQLPPARKKIFLMSRRMFLSNNEIASKLNLSVNTVESQLRKALLFMKQELKKHYLVNISLCFFFLQS